MTDRSVDTRIKLYISTHILTKRMTSCQAYPQQRLNYFNSHPHEEDDTYTSYIEKHPVHFNSHPHEEDDAHPLLSVQLRQHFNSHPHEEDDGRKGDESQWKHISTHILTKRMTAILNKNNLFKIAYYISNKHFISIVDIFFHFHIYF